MTPGKTFDWLVCFFKASDTYLQLPREKKRVRGREGSCAKFLTNAVKGGGLSDSPPPERVPPEEDDQKRSLCRGAWGR